jgi:CBS domain-containing protein
LFEGALPTTGGRHARCPESRVSERATRNETGECVDRVVGHARDGREGLAVTVDQDADYETMLGALRAHSGRRQMPVVDRRGRLVGVLARRDFLAA